MTKQVINVGVTANDRRGDPIRSAFQKVNSNFTELYAAVDDMGNSGVDRAWIGSLGTYNVIEWASGSTIQIVATPFETIPAVTYDARTDSENIYFVWDQNFIDTVWNGWQTPAGEGSSFSVSFDDGATWFPVERSGYNGETFFYFSVPYDSSEQYTFTYTVGQSATIRFNRGSVAEVWFDLADAPVSPDSVVIASDISFSVYATVNGQSVKVLQPSYRFANVLYNDDTGEGDIQSGYDGVAWAGSQSVLNAIEADIRKSADALDAGRIYATFNNVVGTMEFYWNAKLYTFTETVVG